LINLAYLYAMPVEAMAHSPLVASDAMAVALGRSAAGIIAAMIVISTLGSINGNVISTVRITFAMAKDKLFFSWAAKEQPRSKTPGNALWLHAVWIAVLIMSGSFDMLADMFVFITWIVYLFGAVGIFIFRKRNEGLQQSYRCWGYPYVPAIFILFTGFYLVMTIWGDIVSFNRGEIPVINSLAGLALTICGIPFYIYFSWKKRKKNSPAKRGS
jgi:basic amino acid/polyamine antiporter, APA family